MRITLRELLALVAFGAGASAALRYANPQWATASTVAAMVGFLSVVIVAVVDRGPRQARAQGALIGMTLYALLFVVVTRPTGDSGNAALQHELDPDRGRLPTTRLLAPVYHGIVEFWHADRQTGEPTVKASFAGYQSAPRGIVELPRRGHFMVVGHCAWLLLLGYACGFFAAFVYRRRCRDAVIHASPKETPQDRAGPRW